MNWAKRNPRRNIRQTASRLGISRSSKCTEYYKWFKAYYIQKATFSNFYTETTWHAKGCRQRCNLPSYIYPFDSIRRSLQWRQLPTHRMIDWIICVHVMLEICLKVVVPFYAVWLRLKWWSGPQSLLMDPNQKNAFLASWSALDEQVIRRSCHSVTTPLELIVRQNEVISKSDCCNILAIYT